MRRATLVCVMAVLTMLTPVPAPDRATADPDRIVELDFGTLVRGSSCPAATHTILSPCFPYPPGAFVVFQKNKDVTDFEGQNVFIRGVLDQTSCGLPLIRATRIARSDINPPCPPPECQPGDPPPCP